MKLDVSIIFIAVQFSVILATTLSDKAAECGSQCGSLGVMSTSNLPDGIDPANVRTCADHPLGHKRVGVQSLAPKSNADLVMTVANEYFLRSHGDKDDCYFAAPYGCSKGYCWKTCGPTVLGQWCYLAANNGYGNWATCTTYEQCTGLYTPSFNCGENCKAGDNACGCSC